MSTISTAEILDAIGLLARSALTAQQVVTLLNTPELTAAQVEAELASTDALIQQQRDEN